MSDVIGYFVLLPFRQVSKKCLDWVINWSKRGWCSPHHLVPEPRTSFLLEDFGMHELRVATGGDQMVERCWFMVSCSDWPTGYLGYLGSSSVDDGWPGLFPKMLTEHVWLVVWNINFIFPYIGNNHPNWLIFFRGVETTNQMWFGVWGLTSGNFL